VIAMNYEQAHALVGKIVKFKARMEEQEAYPDDMMYARVIGIREDEVSGDIADVDQVWEITFSYVGFEQYNDRVEKRNWYVYKDGVDTKQLGSAKEAGYYKPTEGIYMPGPALWDEYFDVIDADPDGWMPAETAPDNSEPVLVYPAPTWQGDKGHTVAWYSKTHKSWVWPGDGSLEPKFWKPLTVPVAAIEEGEQA
jgi:hypothetical protein